MAAISCAGHSNSFRTQQIAAGISTRVARVHDEHATGVAAPRSTTASAVYYILSAV